MKTIQLADNSLRRIHQMLVERGFVLRSERLLAGRNADGAPEWYRIDSSATSDPNDPKLVPIDCYVHLDGGMVRVFPVGDPTARAVPPNAPAAIKSVLFVPPQKAERGLDADTSFRNEAFRVTDAGDPVPKSARSIYGMRRDPRAPLESYRFARDVAARTIVPLTVEET